MAKFFIRRPIFAWVIAISIMLGGLLAMLGHLSSDLRRIVAQDKIAYRRMKQGR